MNNERRCELDSGLSILSFIGIAGERDGIATDARFWSGWRDRFAGVRWLVGKEWFGMLFL